MSKLIITDENVNEVYAEQPLDVFIPANGLGKAIGILHNYSFKKDLVYKLIFPKKMKDKDDFFLKFANEDENYNIYKNDIESCFIVFNQDVTTLVWLYRSENVPST